MLGTLGNSSSLSNLTADRKGRNFNLTLETYNLCVVKEPMYDIYNIFCFGRITGSKLFLKITVGSYQLLWRLYVSL